MKSKNLILAFCLFGFLSFQNLTTNIVAQTKSAVTDKYLSKIIGNYSGTIGNKPFNLVIESINGSKISGYNQVGTNKRPVSGTIEKKPWEVDADGQLLNYGELPYNVLLKEPGDNNWDGVFTLIFTLDCTQTAPYTSDCNDISKISASGSWKANNGQLKSDVKLEKQ